MEKFETFAIGFLFSLMGMKVANLMTRHQCESLADGEQELIAKEIMFPVIMFSEQLHLKQTLHFSRSFNNKLAEQRCGSAGEALYGISHIADLMKQEVSEKFFVFIDDEKAEFFIGENIEKEESSHIFKSFPSAKMDFCEASNCFALGRNNAAVYHLMCVAEIGLRALAYDRRVTAKLYKKIVPLEYAQWGALIDGVKNKVTDVKNWDDSNIKDAALKFYNSALLEVSALNDGYRRHAMHARSDRYHDEDVSALLASVKRFMSILGERISEGKRTPIVWKGR